MIGNIIAAIAREIAEANRAPSPGTESSGSASPKAAASRPGQREKVTGGIGQVVSAVASGAAVEPSASSPPPEPPFDELLRQFTQAVGKHAMRPKGKPDQLEAKRELRTLAAAVRRRSPRGSRHRQSAREAAVAVRPTAKERRQWAERQAEAAPQPQSSQAASAPDQRYRGSSLLDSLQTGLDALGVADPTPTADWSNAAISLTRAAFDKERRGEHLRNAAISGVSGAVPYLGDTAKLLKVPRIAEKATGGTKAASGAARRTKAAKPTPTTAEKLADSMINMTFGSKVRKRWSDSRKRRREAAASGGGGGRGNGPRVTSGAGGPGDDPNRSPFSWFAGWGQSGSPRHEGQRDATRGRRELERALKEFTKRIEESAKGLAKLGVGAVAAFEGLRLVNSGIIAYNRDLAQYNGQLAVAYGRYRADEIRRSIRSGQAVAEPLSNLVEGQSRLQDFRQQFSDPAKQVSLTVQEKLTNAGATFLEAADRITGASDNLQRAANAITAAMNFDLKAIYEVFTGKASDSKNPDTVFREFLKDVGDGKFDGPKPRFDNRRPGRGIGDGLKNMPLR